MREDTPPAGAMVRGPGSFLGSGRGDPFLRQTERVKSTSGLVRECRGDGEVGVSGGRRTGGPDVSGKTTSSRWVLSGAFPGGLEGWGCGSGGLCAEPQGEGGPWRLLSKGLAGPSGELATAGLSTQG